MQFNQGTMSRSPAGILHRRRGIRIWLPLLLLLFIVARDIRIYSVDELIIGMTISIICIVPSLIWARRNFDRLPSIQIFFLTHLIYYGYPILSGKQEYLAFSEDARITAGFNIIVFLLIVLTIYYGRTLRGSLLVQRLHKLSLRQIPDNQLRIICMRLLIFWLLVVILRNFGFLSYSGDFVNLIWSAGTAAGTIALLLLFRLYGSNNLARHHKILLIFLVAVGIGLSFASGFLISGAIFIVVSVLGYTMGSRRVPWTVAIICLSIVAFLHIGKAEMRNKYWGARGVGTTLSLENVDEIYTDWLSASMDKILEAPDIELNTYPRLIDRSSLMQMQALVTYTSPEIKPFLYGATYLYLPNFLVPRFLWSSKPHGHMATEVLGIHYGIQDAESVQFTSIGFGMPAEAWANFGWAGIIVLGIFFGFMMRFIDSLTIGLPYNAFLSMISIIWFTWCFQLENALSSWMGSFIQTVIMSAIVIYPFTSRPKKT